jgi:O-antigen ligase
MSMDEFSEAHSRAMTMLGYGEAFGEYLALLGPIAMYKLIRTNKPRYYVILFVVCAGLIFTSTRSAIFLFAGTLVILVTACLRDVRLSRLLLIGATLTVCVVTLAVSGSYLSNAVDRMTLAYDDYQEGSNLADVANRASVWQGDYVLSQLNLFGHGLLAPTYYGKISSHMHSLYMTITFQMGVIGAIAYFATLLFILGCLIRGILKSENGARLRNICCFLSFSVFLINESKFEFNRYENYQQVCWSLFAIYYLASKSTCNPFISRFLEKARACPR